MKWINIKDQKPEEIHNKIILAIWDNTPDGLIGKNKANENAWFIDLKYIYRVIRFHKNLGWSDIELQYGFPGFEYWMPLPDLPKE